MKTLSYGFCAAFLFLFLTTGVIAQSNKSKKLFSDAQKSFNDGAYSVAIKTCNNILAEESNYHDALFLLGKSYYMSYDFVGAKDHFTALSNKPDYANSEVLFMLAMTHKAILEYESAKPLFEKYIAVTQDNNKLLKAEIELEGVLMALKNGHPETDFNFANGGNQLNSKNGEIGIAILPADKKIVVTRVMDDPKKLAENIKYRHSQLWIRADDGDEFDFLNSPAYEGTGTFDSTLKNFIFTQCNSTGKACQLMWSRNIDGVWQKAIPLPKSSFPNEFEYKDPHLSGDTLFFSSNRRGGIGGMDLWFSIRNQQGFWTIPINLGEPVNTPFDEVAPFENKNGTFYFSSNGHAGYGLFDVFYVESLNGNRIIHNQGTPFNSSLDDLHFKIYNGQGYLVSNRPGGMGGFDIYTFEERVQKEEIIVLTNHELIDQVYSTLFSSMIYQVNPKFTGEVHQQYISLNITERQDIQKNASEAYYQLTNQKLTSIIHDDKILLASLSKEEKFFIERMAAAYFENEKSLLLNLNEEDVLHFNSLDFSDQRRLYRLSLLIVTDLKGDFDPLVRQKTGKEEITIPTTKKGETATIVPIEASPEVEIPASKLENKDQNTVKKDPSEISNESEITSSENVKPEEGAALATKNPSINEVSSGAQKKDDHRPLEVADAKPVASATIIQDKNDNAFTSYLGVNTSVSFYQNLPFTDKKRVDRIMAIRLVNEKYTLYPGLSQSDQRYFQQMPQHEKDAIERLKLYFRSWSKDKELSNLNDNDLQYLSSLPQNKRDQVARIIVRRGIGLDDENFIKFSPSDWNKYKSFSESEVTMIKNVAQLLKEHQQVFDVALAYAGEGYTFNNNLAYVLTNRKVPVYTTSSDPEQVIQGTKLTYESIYFDPGKYSLRREAIVALNELIDIYRNNPEISLALDAYSFEKGNEPANIQLSTLRTKSAKTYLVNRGIPDYKIIDHAYPANNAGFGNNSMQSLENRKLDIGILNSTNVFQSDFTTYLIQPGNTLFSLSKANGISMDELMALNGLDNTTLYAYQTLRVKKTATLNQDFMVEHSINLVYEPADELQQQNNASGTGMQVSSSEVQPDETSLNDRGENIMVMDVKESSLKATRIHIVLKGERLEDIAGKYNLSINKIMKDNDLKKAKVKRGQKLKIIP